MAVTTASDTDLVRLARAGDETAADETATVVVRSGGGVLDSAVVPLTPAR